MKYQLGLSSAILWLARLSASFSIGSAIIPAGGGFADFTAVTAYQVSIFSDPALAVPEPSIPFLVCIAGIPTLLRRRPSSGKSRENS